MMNKIFYTILIFLSVIYSTYAQQFTADYQGSYEIVDVSNDWMSHSLTLGIKQDKRFNVRGQFMTAQRFGLWDNQFGISGTIFIDSTTYINTGISTSQSVFFADLRGNIELNKNIGKNEISVAYNYLDFDDIINLFSLGYGRYWGNELTMFRTYISKASFLNETLFSFRIVHRHYFGNYDFIELSTGGGQEVSRNTDQLQIVNIQNRNLGIRVSKKLNSTQISLGLTYFNESFEFTRRERLGISLFLGYN